jgi:hypothetical protein
MASEILKVKKRFDYPPDLEETPLVNFNLRNSKLIFMVIHFYWRDFLSPFKMIFLIIRVTDQNFFLALLWQNGKKS